MNFFIGLLTAIHVLVALFLIVLVLMQKSPEQGVGAAFGGGVTETVFGGGTPTALVRMTIWCACILLGTTLMLAVLHSRRHTSGSLMERAIQTEPTIPAGAPTPLPSLPAAAEPAPAAQPAQTPVLPTQPATASESPAQPARAPEPAP